MFDSNLHQGGSGSALSHGEPWFKSELASLAFRQGFFIIIISPAAEEKGTYCGAWQELCSSDSLCTSQERALSEASVTSKAPCRF